MLLIICLITTGLWKEKDVYIEKGMFDKRFKNVNLMLQRSDKLKV